MKQKVIISAAMAAMILLPTALRAQDLSSGYFVEDYTYRYQMNPAFGNSQNFISMPALGNLNVGLHGNLGISDVLYNVDGKTTTFMNPKLSSDEVLKNINDVNRIGTLDKIGILSAGFKAFGGYNTVSINAVADVSVKVPGEMFNLLKNGVANKTYDLGDLRASGVAYGEIAFGHSRQVMKGLRVGATLKFMLGGGYMDAHMRNANLVLGENEWTVTTDADLRSSVKGLTYKTKVNDRTGHRYVNGIDVDGTGLNGFGMALDLGAVYETPVKGLTVSLALLDLGFISWNNDMLATTNGEKTFTTDKYTFNADDDAPNSFSKEWDRLRDDFSAIYELDDMGDQGGPHLHAARHPQHRRAVCAAHVQQAHLRPAQHHAPGRRLHHHRFPPVGQHSALPYLLGRRQPGRGYLRRLLRLGGKSASDRLQLLLRHGPGTRQALQAGSAPLLKRPGDHGHQFPLLTAGSYSSYLSYLSYLSYQPPSKENEYHP